MCELSVSSWEREKQRQNYSIYFHDGFICSPVSFEQKFDNKTRCAFEGSQSLWIYVKCTCALTFPHYGGMHYARIMCLPSPYCSAGRDLT